MVADDPTRCPVCDGRARLPFPTCFCCATLTDQLRMPLSPLRAVTTYEVGDSVHRQLRRYKDAPVAEARDRATGELARLVEGWLAVHADSLRGVFGSDWDLVTTVPSSHRPSGAPADAVVTRVPDLARSHLPLLRRGPVATDHLQASRHGFELAAGVEPASLRGRRVLVVDDSVTTGARAQSASAALRRSGVRVAGILVVGRAVRSTRAAGAGTRRAAVG